MKQIIKKQGVILWIIGGCILYGIAIHLIYGMGNERLQAETATLFRHVIDIDRNNRFQETGLPVYSGYVPNQNDTASYATIENKDHIRHIERTDSIRQLSYTEKQNLALQSVLIRVNPINVHKLDSLFRLECQKKDIPVRTAVRYTCHTTGETCYSDSDTLFYTSAFATEEIQSGIDGEITLQGFVKIKPSFVMRHTRGSLVKATLAWCMFVALAVYLPVRRRKKNHLLPPKTTIPLNQPQKTRYQLTAKICLDMAQQVVIYDDKSILLTKHLALLIESLYNSTNHYAGHDDLIFALYGDDVIATAGKVRLLQTIKRLRKELSPISGLTIKNVHHKGYRLLLPE
ncbi:MAG: hypothetical protein LBN71_10225 [Tannerella sp.]|jgi:hypothetical protein|nr:hypothetical protein [Tannerella sp.]